MNCLAPFTEGGFLWNGPVGRPSVQRAAVLAAGIQDWLRSSVHRVPLLRPEIRASWARKIDTPQHCKQHKLWKFLNTNLDHAFLKITHRNVNNHIQNISSKKQDFKTIKKSYCKSDFFHPAGLQGVSGISFF